MRKRVARALKELYGVTERIMEPEITPVLEGSCRIQGPVDESDHELWRTNSDISSARKKFKFASESHHLMVETGTCNMCSAPCLSCLHNNRTMSAMESNIICGSSRDPCARREADSCSFVGDDGKPPYKSRICDDLQHAASETSNLLSASSSHDSYSENAESKVVSSPSAKCEATEDAHLFPTVPASDTAEERLKEKKMVKDELSSPNESANMSQWKPPSQHADRRVLECHGDNMSCITGTSDSNTGVGHHNTRVDKITAYCNSESMNNLLANEIESTTQIEALKSSYCIESKEEQKSFGKRRISPKESLQKDADCANALLSEKSNHANLQSPNDSPNVQSAFSHSQTGYVDCRNDDDFKELQHEVSLHAVETADSCLKTETERVDNEVASLEAVKSSTVNEKFVAPDSLMEISNVQEFEQQHQQVIEGGSSESEELTDVKVCDICGDAGREHLLAICSRCSDGAEHTYCMREMLHKVPYGDWLCEECQIMEDAERKKAVKECNFNERVEVKVKKSEMLSGAARECKLKVDRLEKVCRKIKPKDNADLKKVERSEILPESLKDLKSKVDIKHKLVHKLERILPTSPKLSTLNEASQNFAVTSNTKLKLRLDMKAIDAGVRRVPKGLQSPSALAKRHAESQEVKSLNSKRPRETSGEPIEIHSPKGRDALSRESSFKNLDTGTSRIVIAHPSNGVQNANKPQILPRSLSTLSCLSTKAQAQLQPPSGFLQRSVSFNNLNIKPKVKLLTENVPTKSRIVRESTLNGSRKETQVRSMTKSASFKSIKSMRTNTESASKSESFHQSRLEDPRSLKQAKERSILEKKTSTLQRPPINSSPRTGSSYPFPKVDMKITPRDLKLNNVSESTIAIKKKLSDDGDGLGRTEVKKSAHATKVPGCASLSLKNNEDQRSCQSPKDVTPGLFSSTVKSVSITETDFTDLHRGPLPTEPTSGDDKTKESNALISSMQAVTGGDPALRCQKCNATGHASQFCSIEKPRSSALKLSAQRNFRDGKKNSSKSKEAVEATTLRSKIRKNDNQSDIGEEVAPSSADPSCVITSNSKDIPLNFSSHTGDIPLVVGTSVGQESLTNSDAEMEHIFDVKLQASQSIEASSSTSRAAQPGTPQVCDLNKPTAVLEKLNAKPLHILPNDASVPGLPIRSGAIPELDFIWQGSLEVLSTENGHTLFDGLQAHLSMSASPKVHDIATRLPCIVQLKEVSCSSSWPLQSQGICLDEHNIALYFFAKDVNSYRGSYSKLLGKMLKDDLALGGTIDGVELLIFPSNKLPMHCQRWNGLVFLWGIFKGRTDNLSSKLSSLKKPSVALMDMNSSVQDLPYDSLHSVVPALQNTVEVVNTDNKLLKALKPTLCLETLAASSPQFEDNMCRAEDSTPAHNTSCKSVADNRSPLKQSSYSFPLSQSLYSMNQLPNLLDTHLKSRFEMTNIRSCSEVKNDDIYLRNSSQESGGRHGEASPTHVFGPNEQFDLNRASPSESISSDQTDIGRSTSSKEIGKTEIIMKGEVIFYDDQQGNLEGTDQVIRNRKRDRPCSMETVSQTFGETMKSNHDIFCRVDDREPKRICYSGQASGSFREENLKARSSSKVHPLSPSFLNEHPSIIEEIPETRGQAERFFFPVEPNRIPDTKSDIVVHILSSDDEDTPESNTPDLELALGGKRGIKKQSLKKFLEEEDDDDDASASLSLSLAIPTLRPKRPVLISEELLQDKPDVNTSLLLFSGFSDT